MINETNLTKLAFVLAANGGGSGSGSSSGGGVMAIEITYDTGAEYPRLTKTWQEIYDCVSGGGLAVIKIEDQATGGVGYAHIDNVDGGGAVEVHLVHTGQVQSFTFVADSPNDYPALAGSSYGGGSLVVTINNGTFNKTWQEIYDAMTAGKCVYGADSQVQDICVISGAYTDGTTYYVDIGVSTYITNSADDFPAMISSGPA